MSVYIPSINIHIIQITVYVMYSSICVSEGTLFQAGGKGRNVPN